MMNYLKNRAVRLIISPTIFLALTFQGIAGANPASADCLSADYMNALTPMDGVFETCGGDDHSYKIPIGGTVIFGGNTYTQIYATTNSVIAFGQADNTWWDFPVTPSVSLDAWDWVERGFYTDSGELLPTYSEETMQSEIPAVRADEYFRITVEGETFRVDIAARPFVGYYQSLVSGKPDGDPRLISIYFVRNSDQSLSIRSFKSNSEDKDFRNGCVLTTGAKPISLEECGILEVVSLDSLATEIPYNTLTAVTPLKIKQNSKQIICKGANLEYISNGQNTSAPNLTSQVFQIKADGKVVAEISTLEKDGVFEKNSIPQSRNLSCTQNASQGFASVIVESDGYGSSTSASLIRRKAVAAAKKTYFDVLQKLGNEKIDALRRASNDDSEVDYKNASDRWKNSVAEAKVALDQAIATSIEKEEASLESDGIRLTARN